VNESDDTDLMDVGVDLKEAHLSGGYCSDDRVSSHSSLRSCSSSVASMTLRAGDSPGMPTDPARRWGAGMRGGGAARRVGTAGLRSSIGVMGVGKAARILLAHFSTTLSIWY
jgi:hypothetical protein